MGRLGSDHLPWGVVLCKQPQRRPWPFKVLLLCLVSSVSQIPVPGWHQALTPRPRLILNHAEKDDYKCKSSFFFLSRKQICALMRHLPELQMHYDNEVRICDNATWCSTLVHVAGGGGACSQVQMESLCKWLSINIFSPNYIFWIIYAQYTNSEAAF